VIDRVSCPLRFASPAAAVAFVRSSPAMLELFAHLDDARRTEAWWELERAYSKLATRGDDWSDGECLVASGVA
jgi:hypothetical protein